MADHDPNLRSGRNRKVRKVREADSRLSDREFNRIEDNLDGISRANGLTRSRRPRSKKTSGLFGFALFAIIAIVVIVGIFGGSSPKAPSCTPHTSRCRETANGVWVPFWYYNALARAQGSTGGSASGGRPSTAGTLPTGAQLRSSGATSAEADDAESYDDSAGAGGGDDSGSDDSDDDGGDDGGDGGGDGGGD